MIPLSASIPISEIRHNIYDFSEFRRKNRPISVFRPFRNPPLVEGISKKHKWLLDTYENDSGSKIVCI